MGIRCRGRGWRSAAAAIVCAAMVTMTVGAPGAQAAKKHFPIPDGSLNGTGRISLASLSAAIPGLGGNGVDYVPISSGAVWIGSTAVDFCESFCMGQTSFARLNSKGRLVESLGQGGVVPFGSESWIGQGRFTSDAEGRLITVSIEPSGKVMVRRFQADGLPDQSFGTAGVTSFSCGCGTHPELTPSVDPQGRILISIDAEIPPAVGHPTSSMGALVRLLPSGQVDSSFGQAGFTPLPAGTGAQYFWPGGGVFAFANSAISEWKPTVERLSKTGAIDTKFDARADAAIAGIVEGDPSMGSRPSAMEFRPGGYVDLIWPGQDGSVVLRLRKDGALETRFGKQGAKRLQMSIMQALPSSDGSIVALASYLGGNTVVLARLTSGYALDKSFGSKGSRVLSTLVEGEGVSMVPTSGGRVTIVDQGLLFCREACAVDPRLLRYRVEPAK